MDVKSILVKLKVYCINFLLIKPNCAHNPASIFDEILVFTATTSTKKNGSVATLGTLGAEKSKFTKKTPPAKNAECKFPIIP